ncbi:MAG TPA: SigE family RNA polymerase sigma factor [Pseudonocardiaceae bacterium]|jgi:RNA polymerase sigma-70 factor (sigma-E family)|nr:SigE family RNA polymerase sigma factor [Pseudonocardiaceae bacterium]
MRQQDVHTDKGFDDYVAAELNRLLGYANALIGDPHLAADVVQEVLLKARSHFSRMTTPDAYLRRMIMNEHITWRRRRANRDVVLMPGHAIHDATLVADHGDAYAERDAMRTRLATLPPKQRAALVLRYYEDRTDDEIAKVLDCRVGTVRSQISRALATLRAAEHAARPNLALGAAL